MQNIFGNLRFFSKVHISRVSEKKMIFGRTRSLPFLYHRLVRRFRTLSSWPAHIRSIQVYLFCRDLQSSKIVLSRPTASGGRTTTASTNLSAFTPDTQISAVPPTGFARYPLSISCVRFLISFSLHLNPISQKKANRSFVLCVRGRRQ